MPRNNAVDYPQVPYRSQMQPALGLAPPSFITEQDRYSWQVTPIDVKSPRAEDQFEAANSRRRQQEQVNSQTRQSRIPPLPILPDHLAQDETRESEPSPYIVLASQERHLVQAQFQQQQPVLHSVEVRDGTAQSYLNLPQNYQESKSQENTPERGTNPSREQSLHQQQQLMNTFEAPVAGVSLKSNLQPHTSIAPVSTGRYLSPVKEVQSPAEEKLPSPDEPTQAQPIQVGPDENPLLPPSTVHFPASNSGRPTPLQAELQFPHSSHFNPAQPSQGGTWHHSLGSCADPTTCLSSLFCPCLIYGRTQHRLSLKSSGKDSTNMLGFSSFNGSCIAWSVLPGVNVLLTAIQHRRIRKAYKMDGQAGNFVGDCVKGICCCCCMLAQAEKEMKVREISVANKIDEYISPVDMVFAPQVR